ncbi:MAG: PHP domain-containing protein [Chloroflexi bacterium]|nr:PHP domain-containing protein [Chloroflexota bacterium]
MISVEFHCHTYASKDCLTRPADLIAAARRKKIDRIIITDHNSIAGASEAKAIASELVIIGEEIMTSKGEILAAFVSEEVPPFLTPQETIKRLKAQGSFISVSHPFDELREGGWDETDLLEILPFVDAIEVYNSRCMIPRFNRRAELFAQKYNIAGTVGSDAHAAFEVGRSLLWLDQFSGPDEMRSVIRAGIPRVKWSPPWFHLASRSASMIKKFSVCFKNS